MNLVYPVVISKTKSGKYHDVYIPDLQVNTEGKTLADAIIMARDAIGAKCLAMEDLKQEFPVASDVSEISCNADEFISLVDLNYDEYKRKNAQQFVRRNVTLPSWLDYEAKQSGVNVSAILVRALKQELNLS